MCVLAEGIALGVPVFFATGSRWKAIGWAAASGLAEPLGALIGLALQLTGNLSTVAMGFIMAAVAGVMTGIAFQELLPRYGAAGPAHVQSCHAGARRHAWSVRSVTVALNDCSNNKGLPRCFCTQ